MDREETERLKKAWPAWGEGGRLVVLDSPHNMVLEAAGTGYDEA
jgi:hypothetical protein